MAKKSKIIEIKAQTEPTRGAGEDADPSDPVLIMYPRGASEEIIGSLAGGEEDEAIIKTAGCIVPGDITIRYAVPSAGVPIVVTNNTEDEIAIFFSSCATLTTDNAGHLIWTEEVPTIILPAYDAIDGYYIEIEIPSDADKYTITANDTPIPFISSLVGYDAPVRMQDYPSAINIVVSNKE